MRLGLSASTKRGKKKGKEGEKLTTIFVSSLSLAHSVQNLLFFHQQLLPLHISRKNRVKSLDKYDVRERKREREERKREREREKEKERKREREKKNQSVITNSFLFNMKNRDTLRDTFQLSPKKKKKKKRKKSKKIRIKIEKNRGGKKAKEREPHAPQYASKV